MMLDGNKAVKKSVRIKEQELNRASYPPLLENVRASVTPGAFDYLMDEYKSARPLRARGGEGAAADWTRKVPRLHW